MTARRKIVHEYPCEVPGCPIYYRSTDMAAAAGNVLRHEAEHRRAVVMNIQTGGRPEVGAIKPWLLIPVVFFGLFLWGWTHSASRPNGATLLAIAGLAFAGALILTVGKTIRGYWVLEKQDKTDTKEQLEQIHEPRLAFRSWDPFL